ncbi:hypothetical protein BpHYR1_034968 [Brachionus plicatilis]|uniref:Uncharacterized protein n=1 Tax=Brachionus plicatilis TaxID=10195 RepID=A0A3M7S411_BRAPC|nr:hypothetical protein BpHYR1_034968 [Brachionus plicatilis]
MTPIQLLNEKKNKKWLEQKVMHIKMVEQMIFFIQYLTTNSKENKQHSARFTPDLNHFEIKLFTLLCVELRQELDYKKIRRTEAVC